MYFKKLLLWAAIFLNMQPLLGSELDADLEHLGINASSTETQNLQTIEAVLTLKYQSLLSTFLDKNSESEKYTVSLHPDLKNPPKSEITSRFSISAENPQKLPPMISKITVDLPPRLISDHKIDVFIQWRKPSDLLDVLTSMAFNVDIPGTETKYCFQLSSTEK